VYKIIGYFKNFVSKIIYAERSCHKLALSCSIGIFIAFSPYIGLHNIMIFLFSWLLNLDPITTFTVAHINNPITTVPFLSASYLFGGWIIDFFGITTKFTNPSYIDYINSKLTLYLGVPKICFWTFFIGSNLLGILLAILLYPILKKVFRNLINKQVA
jgi:uncharacterized protein (DUF2062 family)